MTGGSIYSRQTDESGYDEGVELMSELDYMLREKGGLRRALKDFYSTYQKKLVTNEIFMQFMSEKVGKDLKSIFDKYVFGEKSRKRRVNTYSPLKQRHLQ
jgi:predicted metalloprotease with PDZ domain